MTAEGLPRSWRLTKGSEIRAAFAGRRYQTPRFELFWRSNDLGHPRLAVIVPRYGATAVARNRVRRRLREAARRRVVPKLESLDILVRARRAAYGSPASELAGDMDRWVASHAG